MRGGDVLIQVRRIEDTDRQWVETALRTASGSNRMARLGRLYEPAIREGFVAVDASWEWYSFYTWMASTLEFEFDPDKSTANRAKHGIDFIEAQQIWTDVDRLEIPARSLEEPRHQVIGRIGEQSWSAFITYRNEKIRIISVRRARPDEEARYLAD